jgi:hypothetical protein
MRTINHPPLNIIHIDLERARNLCVRQIAPDILKRKGCKREKPDLALELCAAPRDVCRKGIGVGGRPGTVVIEAAVEEDLKESKERVRFRGENGVERKEGIEVEDARQLECGGNCVHSGTLSLGRGCGERANVSKGKFVRGRAAGWVLDCM